jgi:ketosteroid isomerase-like protein
VSPDPLRDKDDIRELLARYCHLLDGYRLAAFGELFTADGVWESQDGTATGPAAITALLARLVPTPGPGTRRRHHTTNTVIDLDGDRATALSNFLVVRDAGGSAVVAVSGSYRDVLRRTGSGWRFAHRTLAHDILGDSGLNRL